jgi:hypothetical protein
MDADIQDGNCQRMSLGHCEPWFLGEAISIFSHSELLLTFFHRSSFCDLGPAPMLGFVL